jgi:hypothetical protein
LNYLVAQHSMQTISWALLLRTPVDTGTSPFVTFFHAFGEPLHNAADARSEVSKQIAWRFSPRLTHMQLVHGAAEFDCLLENAQEPPRSRVEMLGSNPWHAARSNWASDQVMGGER